MKIYDLDSSFVYAHMLPCMRIRSMVCLAEDTSILGHDGIALKIVNALLLKEVLNEFKW